MATTYGDFPGVKVTVAGGGITSVALGNEERLVLFGAATYENDGTFGSDGDVDAVSGDASANDPTTINARRQADANFGADSKLAQAMREALANGANIDFLTAVAPERVQAVAETSSTQSGTLSNAPIYEDQVSDEANLNDIVVRDSGGTDPEVRFKYDGAPTQPSDSDVIHINPLTGEYAADAAPTGSNYEFDYKYLDWNSAFTDSTVRDVISPDDTGVYVALTDADSVSSDLESEVSSLRDDFQLATALNGAEPNDNQVVNDDSGNYQRTDARFDTGTYSTTGTQSIDADYYFKIAPARVEDEKRTVLGGVGGLFAGNPLDDPIYNDEVTGYDGVEQSFTKTDADNMRDENIIPIRQAGAIRVKDNLSTSTSTDWERDFWRRRIADRVILVGKTIGDSIIGQINDEETRKSAERLIKQELRDLVDARLLQPNAGGGNSWYVDVYPDDSNTNQVNIDIGFTPYGIVKRIDENITINT